MVNILIVQKGQRNTRRTWPSFYLLSCPKPTGTGFTKWTSRAPPQDSRAGLSRGVSLAMIQRYIEGNTDARRKLEVCFINTPPVLQGFSWERHAPAWLLEPAWSPAFPWGHWRRTYEMAISSRCLSVDAAITGGTKPRRWCGRSFPSHILWEHQSLYNSKDAITRHHRDFPRATLAIAVRSTAGRSTRAPGTRSCCRGPHSSSARLSLPLPRPRRPFGYQHPWPQCTGPYHHLSRRSSQRAPAVRKP